MKGRGGPPGSLHFEMSCERLCLPVTRMLPSLPLHGVPGSLRNLLFPSSSHVFPKHFI